MRMAWAWRRVIGSLPALLLALPLGCARHDLDLGRGGLSAEDDARLSLAFAQVRAQAPSAQVSGLNYVPRAEPEGLPEPELALSGDGTSLNRGFQAAEASHVRLALYLDKFSYTRGYARITRAGTAEEVWRIVAYQLRGQADSDFEFIYLLADPGGSLRTLILAGGKYQAGKTDRLAIEGVLLLPDPERRGKAYTPDEWKTAYPLPFVLGEPVPPLYQTLTAEAVELGQQLDREGEELERLAQRVDALDAEIAKADANAPQGQAGSPPADTGAPSDKAASRRAELEKQLRQRAAQAQAKAVHCFQVRAQGDSAFAAYLRTNAYAWRDADGRQEAFARWEALDKQAGPLEERVARLLPYAPEPQAVEAARAAALAIFVKNNNASHRPAPVKE